MKRQVKEKNTNNQKISDPVILLSSFSYSNLDSNHHLSHKKSKSKKSSKKLSPEEERKSTRSKSKSKINEKKNKKKEDALSFLKGIKLNQMKNQISLNENNYIFNRFISPRVDNKAKNIYEILNRQKEENFSDGFNYFQEKTLKTSINDLNKINRSKSKKSINKSTTRTKSVTNSKSITSKSKSNKTKSNKSRSVNKTMTNSKSLSKTISKEKMIIGQNFCPFSRNNFDDEEEEEGIEQVEEEKIYYNNESNNYSNNEKIDDVRTVSSFEINNKQLVVDENQINKLKKMLLGSTDLGHLRNNSKNRIKYFFELNPEENKIYKRNINNQDIMNKKDPLVCDFRKSSKKVSGNKKNNTILLGDEILSKQRNKK